MVGFTGTDANMCRVGQRLGVVVTLVGCRFYEVGACGLANLY